MLARIPLAALLACAIAAALSMPAGASPKTDCEAALEKAEAIANGSLGRGQANKVRKSINNARDFRDKGKFKKCAEMAELIIKQNGTN